MGGGQSVFKWLQLPPSSACSSFPHQTSYAFFLVICTFDLANELNVCVVDYVGELEECGADRHCCRSHYRTRLGLRGEVVSPRSYR